MACLLPQKQVRDPAVELQAHAAETCLDSTFATCHWLAAEPSERSLRCLEPSSNPLDYRKFRLKGMKTSDAPGTTLPPPPDTRPLRSPSLGMDLGHSGGLVSLIAVRSGPEVFMEAGEETLERPNSHLRPPPRSLMLCRATPPCLINAVHVSLPTTWKQGQICIAGMLGYARWPRKLGILLFVSCPRLLSLHAASPSIQTRRVPRLACGDTRRDHLPDLTTECASVSGGCWQSPSMKDSRPAHQPGRRILEEGLAGV